MPCALCTAFQVNAGPDLGRWKLMPFMLHEYRSSGTTRHLLRGGDPVLLIHRATEMNLICDEGRVSFEARPQDGSVSSNALWRLQPLGAEWGGRYATCGQVRETLCGKARDGGCKRGTVYVCLAERVQEFVL